MSRRERYHLIGSHCKLTLKGLPAAPTCNWPCFARHSNRPFDAASKGEIRIKLRAYLWSSSRAYLARTDPVNLYGYGRQKDVQDAFVSKAEGLLPFIRPAYDLDPS